jgi:elongation factor P
MEVIFMISAMDFRPGVTFMMDNVIYEVVQFQHVQRPRLAPLVRAKIKNIKSGGIIERTFSPEDKFEDVTLEQKELHYSYKSGENYVFMDTETYEQYEFTAEQIGESLKFLKEDMPITMLLHNGNILGIKLPTKVDLKVIQAPPGIKGDSAGGVTKPITLETGAVVNAPLFVKEGDIVRIDTRTGEYVERVRE